MSEITCVVGARPNFMKMAPILQALEAYPEIRPFLVHTGQHYDEAMSSVFFDDLRLPKPDRHLEVGSDTHARQCARIMIAFEALLEERPSRLVLVVGDVNSTMACALVAVKRGIPVAHVEAGLRSRDRTMPEEINRLVTDAVSDVLFATSPDAIENLLAEGLPRAKVHFVGNPMIDTLTRHLERARARRVEAGLGVSRGGYALVTLHRPSNVDDPERLAAILASLGALAGHIPVVFPAHPRTRERMAGIGFAPGPGVRLLTPQGYLDFLGLMDAARFVLTDSGGVQEETTALGVPCLTLRVNTERPVTILEGTNRLLGDNPDAILPAALPLLRGALPKPSRPALWDGRAGTRIAQILARRLGADAEAASNTPGAREDEIIPADRLD